MLSSVTHMILNYQNTSFANAVRLKIFCRRSFGFKNFQLTADKEVLTCGLNDKIN